MGIEIKMWSFELHAEIDYKPLNGLKDFHGIDVFSCTV